MSRDLVIHFESTNWRIRDWVRADGEVVTILELRDESRDGKPREYDDPSHYDWIRFGGDESDQADLADLLALLRAGQAALLDKKNAADSRTAVAGQDGALDSRSTAERARVATGDSAAVRGTPSTPTPSVVAAPSGLNAAGTLQADNKENEDGQCVSQDVPGTERRREGSDQSTQGEGRGDVRIYGGIAGCTGSARDGARSHELGTVRDVGREGGHGLRHAAGDSGQSGLHDGKGNAMNTWQPEVGHPDECRQRPAVAGAATGAVDDDNDATVEAIMRKVRWYGDARGWGAKHPGENHEPPVSEIEHSLRAAVAAIAKSASDSIDKAVNAGELRYHAICRAADLEQKLGAARAEHAALLRERGRYAKHVAGWQALVNNAGKQLTAQFAECARLRDEYEKLDAAFKPLCPNNESNADLAPHIRIGEDMRQALRRIVAERATLTARLAAGARA